MDEKLPEDEKNECVNVCIESQLVELKKKLAQIDQADLKTTKDTNFYKLEDCGSRNINRFDVWQSGT